MSAEVLAIVGIAATLLKISEQLIALIPSDSLSEEEREIILQKHREVQEATERLSALPQRDPSA